MIFTKYYFQISSGATTILQPQNAQQDQIKTIFNGQKIIQPNVQALSPNSIVLNGGASGPTSPVQVVPQAMESPSSNLNMSTKNELHLQQRSRNSGVQELPVTNSTPILMSSADGATTFCTAAGVSNQNTKKIILQPLGQQSNQIILTSGGQPILLQTANPGMTK